MTDECRMQNAEFRIQNAGTARSFKTPGTRQSSANRMQNAECRTQNVEMNSARYTWIRREAPND
jgi:hypothetical protein